MKTINHPRDVYPYCSGEFASGVRAFLNGDKRPEYPDSKERLQGYLCAERDLDGKYTMSDSPKEVTFQSTPPQ